MAKNSELTFQQAVSALERFWANEGCLIWQPYYTQVGAGTMNPATFLRVLGPEPWRVAYVEPSIRPDDARYGENPNRMGMHYQYQVLLKPDPGNPQEIYLRSLEALGIDPRAHDIRFVEDRWEAPPLGAWGLGWEVWLDGLEITQFTYFQQAGGMSLDPVSVEITYGLERILMAVQGVGDFKDIRWDARRTYGDLLFSAEFEHSVYFFDTADVERLLKMFGDFEAEALSSLDKGLLYPAYDYLLKCSHTFNVLDARGAVGVAERASYFGRMRDIAGKVAWAYLHERENKGFPWTESVAKRIGKRAQKRQPSDRLPVRPVPFVLELGTEELPVGDLSDALAQLEVKLPALLEELRLEHRGIEIMGTPRRLVVHVKGLAARQADRTRTVKGPPANRAFDEHGNPTAAARGFAKSAGVPVSALRAQDFEAGRYVVADIKEVGVSAAEVLEQALPGLFGSLEFEQPMRWDGSRTAFPRPIRWLLALHGSCLVAFEFAGLQSDRITRGLRSSKAERIGVLAPDAYFGALRRAGIILDRNRRQATIVRKIRKLATQVGGRVLEDPELLEEVTNLVESPAAVLGSFDEGHLQLPREVLVSVMKVHQRYFPVESKKGLRPYFIAIGNGVGGRQVRRGNEQVIRARFADAAYFVARDSRQPLAAYVPRLASLTYQADLGSMLDKTRRVGRLAKAIAQHLALSESEQKVAGRAAELCKADLVTQMVKDMTSLQGAMGRYYALRSGESPEVAEAIFEQYLPRTTGDDLPTSQPGVVLALADRLDTLMGLFAVGIQPTGTRDPYAMRRAAIGLVQILVGRHQRFDLHEGLARAYEGLGEITEAEFPQAGQALQACLEFIAARQQRLLLDGGWPYDVVDSVLAEQGHDPFGAYRAVETLAKWVKRDDWPRTLQAYARCVRITREHRDVPQFEPASIDEEAERELYQALLKAEAAPRQPGSVHAFVQAFRPMIPAIDRFFEEVLVMADQRELRENRLGLLRRVTKLADGVADLSSLEGF